MFIRYICIHTYIYVCVICIFLSEKFKMFSQSITERNSKVVIGKYEGQWEYEEREGERRGD